MTIMKEKTRYNMNLSFEIIPDDVDQFLEHWNEKTTINFNAVCCE